MIIDRFYEDPIPIELPDLPPSPHVPRVKEETTTPKSNLQTVDLSSPPHKLDPNPPEEVVPIILTEVRYCDPDLAIQSIALFIIDVVIRIHNSLLDSEQNPWVKTCNIVAMDLLLLPAAAIAVVETIIRLIVAELMCPLFLVGLDRLPLDMAGSALISLAQVPYALSIAIKTFTTHHAINPVATNREMQKQLYCGKSFL